MKVLFVLPNKDAFGYKPIGLALLSAIAKKLGWETKLFDTTEIDFGFYESKSFFKTAKMFKPVDYEKYDMVKKKIDLKEKFTEIFKDYNPDLVAFSVLSDQFMIANKITEIAKELNPNVLVLWGGAHATLAPENILKDYGADFVCVGEGFDAFEEFLTAVEEKKNLYDIENIWGIKAGEIIKNEVRPLKQNLDDLPYVDWDIFDKRHFYKPFSGKMYIGGDHMLNWGCVNNCTYCINNFYHNLYLGKSCGPIRRYSAKRIITELKYLKEKYGIEFFKFFDEDFLLRPLNSLKELSELYKEEVNVPFSIETNPKFVDEDRVRLLKNMNCVNVSLGVETGDLKARKEILGRIDSEEDIVRAFKLLKEAGIKTSSFNMLGLPFESRETYNKTIGINRKADPQYPQCCFFYPFKGTKLRDVSINMGLFDPKDEDTMVFRHDKPALHFKHLTEEELVEMRNVFVLYIKLPKEYEPFIRRSEQRDETGMKLRDKILEIYDKTVWANDGWYIDDGLKEDYLTKLTQIMNNQKNIIEINIASRKIGENNPCFIIAEAGVNHNGDILLAKKMIDCAVKAGADVVKFQTFFTDELVTAKAPKSIHQSLGSEEHESQYDLLKRLELSEDNFAELTEYAKEKNIIFMSTPYDLKSVDLLDKLGVPAFKIASADIVDLPLLKKAAEKNKPIILAAGMADISEIKEAIETIYLTGNRNIILLHCVSNYPPLDENINLNLIKTFKEMFKDLVVGYSDHSAGKTAVMGAVSMGANVIERHFTLDKNLPGPDHKSSLNPEELKEMIDDIRILEKQLGNGEKNIPAEEEEMKKIFRKSIIAKENIKMGAIIDGAMLKMARPGTGLKANKLSELIGKKTNVDILKDEIIKLEMFE